MTNKSVQMKFSYEALWNCILIETVQLLALQEIIRFQLMSLETKISPLWLLFDILKHSIWQAGNM